MNSPVLASRHIWLLGPVPPDNATLRRHTVSHAEVELESGEQVSCKCGNYKLFLSICGQGIGEYF